MEMGVDEPRHRNTSLSVNLTDTLVAIEYADHTITGDRNIGGQESARDQIEQPDIAYDQIGGLRSGTLTHSPLDFMTHHSLPHEGGRLASAPEERLTI
ncbi:hypothetical protein AA0535_2912 [Asaia krungthepensis NRIC 0535]|uniref:Uncharacterized protein n=1 Tax=Asaia krungthepensis NRIC 0535 TaxID=1307925 RepID=A0ABQ0Q6K0_9PROT|nr:hypothetical protein AA0535_2912 [Asaia krungthepensis NRIC 0535]